MKRREFEKQLRKEVNGAPDAGSLNTIRSRLGLSEEDLPDGGNTAVRIRRRSPSRWIAILAVCVAAVVAATVLPLVSLLQDDPSAPPGGGLPSFLTRTDAYALAAVSTGGLLHTGGVSLTSSFAPAAGTPVDENIAEELDAHISLVDALIGSSLSPTTEISDREGYAMKETMTVHTLSGVEVYVLYYTETPLSGDGEEIDDEVETRLEGILSVGGEEFSVIGEREREDDEMELEFIAYRDSLNYAVFEQEIEDGEQSFEYSVYRDGALADSFELEIEEDDGRREITLSSVSDGVAVEYRVTEADGGLRIVRKSNGQTMRLFAVPETENGVVKYRYYTE